MKHHKNVNFVDPTQTRKAYEVLMCDANHEAQYTSTKYILWIDPLYFQVDKFIPTLEKHFPDILDEILNHDDQRSAPENFAEFTTSYRHSHKNKGQTQRPPIPRFLKPRNRG